MKHGCSGCDDPQRTYDDDTASWVMCRWLKHIYSYYIDLLPKLETANASVFKSSLWIIFQLMLGAGDSRLIGAVYDADGTCPLYIILVAIGCASQDLMFGPLPLVPSSSPAST